MIGPTYWINGIDQYELSSHPATPPCRARGVLLLTIPWSAGNTRGISRLSSPRILTVENRQRCGLNALHSEGSRRVTRQLGTSTNDHRPCCRCWQRNYMQLFRSYGVVDVQSAAQVAGTSHESGIECYPRPRCRCDVIGCECFSILYGRNGLHRRRTCQGRKD